ncbi:MAG: gephyrin-like molybdotransferase Glp [Candidatus Eisenbacteria bacterium]
MISFDDALGIVLGSAPRPRAETVPLASAPGRILARAVRADRDLPPFDRAALDGYAFRLADGEREFGEERQLPVAGEVAAGQRYRRALRPGSCVRIWTGAATPAGAQGIVPVERSTETDGIVRLSGPVEIGGPSRAGICDRGEDARRGAVLLEKGRRIGPGEAAILAATGHAQVAVHARPRISLLLTGAEVVPPGARPSAEQIRSTHGAVLGSLLRASGLGEARELGIVGDSEVALRRRIARGLEESDLLLITGGVSAGRLDLVPGVLRALGVRILFHKVAIRPGKPVLFGTGRMASGGTVRVFGLPGNPVSVLATAVLFVLPFLRAWEGDTPAAPLTVRLDEPIRRGGGLLHFVPSALSAAPDATLRCRPLPSHGSGDFVSASGVRALLRVPGDSETRPEGSILTAVPVPVPGPLSISVPISS